MSKLKELEEAMGKINIEPATRTFTELVAALRDYERQRNVYIRELDAKVTELERITGYSLDELIELYRAGRLLVYPESR